MLSRHGEHTQSVHTRRPWLLGNYCPAEHLGAVDTSAGTAEALCCESEPNRPVLKLFCLGELHLALCTALACNQEVMYLGLIRVQAKWFFIQLRSLLPLHYRSREAVRRILTAKGNPCIRKQKEKLLVSIRSNV